MVNSIGHVSPHITRAQVCEMIDAATFAWRSDIPLTVALHFQLERLERRPQQFISAYTKQVGDWLRTMKVPRIYIWALERPAGKSINAHMLVHIPDRLRKNFANMQRTWIRAAGLIWKPKTLRFQKIGIKPGTKDRQLGQGEYLMHLEIALGYMLKGTDVSTGSILRIDQCSPQGIW